MPLAPTMQLTCTCITALHPSPKLQGIPPEVHQVELSRGRHDDHLILMQGWLAHLHPFERPQVIKDLDQVHEVPRSTAGTAVQLMSDHKP